MTPVGGVAVNPRVRGNDDTLIASIAGFQQREMIRSVVSQ